MTRLNPRYNYRPRQNYFDYALKTLIREVLRRLVSLILR